MIILWKKVMNLPFNLCCPPWVDLIAQKVGDFVKVGTNEKGNVVGGD
jgi:hypothetical protein